jgi:hypothetical protein
MLLVTIISALVFAFLQQLTRLREMDSAMTTHSVGNPEGRAVGLVAALRCAARERGGPLPSIAVADALLDEREWFLGSGRVAPMSTHCGRRGPAVQAVAWAFALTSAGANDLANRAGEINSTSTVALAAMRIRRPMRKGCRLCRSLRDSRILI